MRGGERGRLLAQCRRAPPSRRSILRRPGRAGVRRARRAMRPPPAWSVPASATMSSARAHGCAARCARRAAEPAAPERRPPDASASRSSTVTPATVVRRADERSTSRSPGASGRPTPVNRTRANPSSSGRTCAGCTPEPTWTWSTPRRSGAIAGHHRQRAVEHRRPAPTAVGARSRRRARLRSARCPRGSRRRARPAPTRSSRS